MHHSLYFSRLFSFWNHRLKSDAWCDGMGCCAGRGWAALSCVAVCWVALGHVVMRHIELCRVVPCSAELNRPEARRAVFLDGVKVLHKHSTTSSAAQLSGLPGTPLPCDRALRWAPGAASPCTPHLHTDSPTRNRTSTASLQPSREQQCWGTETESRSAPRALLLLLTRSAQRSVPAAVCGQGHLPLSATHLMLPARLANQRGKSHVNGLRAKGRRSFAVPLHRSAASAGRVGRGSMRTSLRIFLGGSVQRWPQTDLSYFHLYSRVQPPPFILNRFYEMPRLYGTLAETFKLNKILGSPPLFHSAMGLNCDIFCQRHLPKNTAISEGEIRLSFKVI